jgi:hypothetical protein
MQNRQGNRPGSSGQRQSQNPMQPSDPSVSNPASEEEEEEEGGGSRQQDEEEATSIGSRDQQQSNRGGSQQSNRGSPGNQGQQGRDN